MKSGIFSLAIALALLASPAFAHIRTFHTMPQGIGYGLEHMMRTANPHRSAYEVRAPHAHPRPVYRVWRGRVWVRGLRQFYADLPIPCRLAAREGGPCGCLAEGILLGTYAHVRNGVNLWLANGWLRFPRTSPHAGAAAVWPGRHVAPVVGVNGDGTVTVHDSWGIHAVRTAGLVFVEPR